jgi:hypothetical protein
MLASLVQYRINLICIFNIYFLYYKTMDIKNIFKISMPMAGRSFVGPNYEL